MATKVGDGGSTEIDSGITTERPTLEPAKVALCLGFLTFLAYTPTLGNEFVSFDDISNFVKNDGFRGVGWENIRWAWTTLTLGVYQPVAWMLIEVQYLFTGLNPYGYHLTSTMMHAVNAVVLFDLTLAIVRRCRPDLEEAGGSRLLLMSALAVAFFATHPMRTEVVAWASAQPYLPCAFFAMLSVLAYLKANPTGATEVRSRWLVASFLLYAGSVLSKAAAVPLPLVFVILDFYPLGRLGGDRGWWNLRTRAVIVEKLPFLVLCGLFMGVAILAKASNRTLTPISHVSISERLILSCYSVMFYPINSFWPSDIRSFDLRPVWAKLFEPRLLIAMVGTVAATAVMVRRRGRHPGMLAAWMAYLVLLAPVSGLISIGFGISANRYGYVTMMAFVAPMAVGFCDLSAWLARFRIARQVQIVGAMVMIAPLLVLTYAQCRTWKDSEAFLTNGIEHGGSDFAELHNQLGITWGAKGEYFLAIFAFQEALRIDPHHQDARNNLDKAIAGQAQAKPKPKTKA